MRWRQSRTAEARPENDRQPSKSRTSRKHHPIAGILLMHPPSSYITGNTPEVPVGNAQKRAIQNYRARLGERGLARFEVLGRDADRDLIRSLARRLAEDTPEASELRATVRSSIAGEPKQPGGILAALRRSPLVGADLNLSRSREEGRKVDL
jgi:hypothetical protein